ncbi:hypothetical protein [Xenorhabdus sp. IM139775]|uniref:hypothetical protein n=1 Tax=Xenorhabdus sp. IM139775 TaxID=3025876 RepID=UPI002358C6C9|nr:hypothetical protein [Xenorhabdus sp. IM139775]MDC9594960.1 hypothetical protein [Xenorhabdus sp. IM139775]
MSDIYSNYGCVAYISSSKNVHALALMKALDSIDKKYHSSKFNFDGKGNYNGFIIPYPPGIPLLIPGQEISEVIMEKINLAKTNSTSLIFIKEEEL